MPATAPPPQPPALREAADRGVGVVVLTTPELWELVTAFQPGYASAVHAFYKSKTSDVAVLDRLCTQYARHHDECVGKLTRKGLLPHLAIANDNFQILRLLFKMRWSTSVQYQRDPWLSVSKTMRCAVVCSSIPALECVLALWTAYKGMTLWEPNLLRIAIQRDNPDLRVLEWLVAHLPEKLSIGANEPHFANDVQFHTEKGNVEIVQWLQHHHQRVVRMAQDEQEQSCERERMIIKLQTTKVRPRKRHGHDLFPSRRPQSNGAQSTPVGDMRRP